ncbi:hypothetical protein [Paractinoplanes globisporus]|uniref:Uncharacterized protein n=1 Tax=Paractinoplanes globisporus TaxID=113565 RepID=A0ABW6WXE5_9ACTN|nr:hypothetical protein [Actinoplanes globisporus]
MAAQNKKPGTAAREVARPGPDHGPHAVSELVSDRAAAPSPFGDDQTFPLPLERLTYISADKF